MPIGILKLETALSDLFPPAIRNNHIRVEPRRYSPGATVDPTGDPSGALHQHVGLPHRVHVYEPEALKRIASFDDPLETTLGIQPKVRFEWAILNSYFVVPWFVALGRFIYTFAEFEGFRMIAC